MAKFHGDRPRELGDPVAREKKTSAVKYKASRNGSSGRPNKEIERKQYPVPLSGSGRGRVITYYYYFSTVLLYNFSSVTAAVALSSYKTTDG